MEQSLNLIKTQQELAKMMYELMGGLLKEQTLVNAGVDITEFLDDEYDELEEITDNPFIVVAGGAARDWHMGNPARDIDMYLLIKNFNDFHKQMFGKWPNKVYQDPQILRDYYINSGLESDLLRRTPLLVWIGDYLVEKGIGFTRMRDKSYSKENHYRDNAFMTAVVEVEIQGQEFDLIFFSGERTGSIVVKEHEKPARVEFNVTINNTVLGDKATMSFGDFVISTYDFNICKAYYDFNVGSIITCDYFIEDVNNKTLTIVQGLPAGSLKHGIFKHYPKLQQKFPDFKFNPITLAGI